MASEVVVDVLIIGGGPAGLGAAVSIVRNVHSAIVFDSNEYRNERSNHMHMVPTWDGKDPKMFRAAARQNVLDVYDTLRFIDTKVVSIRKNEDGLFEAGDDQGTTWRGKGLILATGIIDTLPDIPGVDDCWCRSMSVQSWGVVFLY